MLGMASIIVVVAAFFAAFIDTSLGLCYGTILTPFLLLAGYQPELAVPAVLLSQLVVDVGGSVMHTKVKNFTSKDVKSAVLVTIPATLFVPLGAFLNVTLPVNITKAYIGILVTVLGILIVAGIRVKKTSDRIIFMSGIAGLNKGMVGGGFGPVVVSGQIALNSNIRPAIAIKHIAEVPVCIVGLLTFALFENLTFSPIFLIVCLPALIAAVIGPYMTIKVSQKRYAERMIGMITFLLGFATILKLIY